MGLFIAAQVHVCPDTQAPRFNGFFRSGYVGLEAQELGILNPSSSAVKVGSLGIKNDSGVGSKRAIHLTRSQIM